MVGAVAKNPWPSLCPAQVESSLGGIVGTTFDLLATVHDGGDKEDIYGRNRCVGCGEPIVFGSKLA